MCSLFFIVRIQYNPPGATEGRGPLAWDLTRRPDYTEQDVILIPVHGGGGGERSLHVLCDQITSTSILNVASFPHPK